MIWKLLPKDGKNPPSRLGFRAPPSDTVPLTTNWSKSGVTGFVPWISSASDPRLRCSCR